MTFAFEITHKDPNSYAHLGRLTTPHGTINTPNFIFCGTKASVSYPPWIPNSMPQGDERVMFFLT